MDDRPYRWTAGMTRNVVELRVHGVNGGPAEEILDQPLVVRVAGDTNAGFYRPRPGCCPDPEPAGVTTEAYRWGGLTAGATARTLSLLVLLPFMLSNLAIWLRPPTRGPDLTLTALCRLIAAAVTANYVLAIIGTTIDLIGWQCVPYHRCVEGRPYLAWLAAVPTGPRLALLALIPAAALRVAWWIGSRSARTLDDFRRAHPVPPEDGPDATHGTLDAPGFWGNATTLARLRSAHVAIGLSVLNASLLGAIIPIDQHRVGQLLLVVVVVLLAVSLVPLGWPALIDPARSPRWAGRVVPALAKVATGLTVLTHGHHATAELTEAPIGRLPGYDTIVTGLIAAQTALIAVLTAVVLGRRVRNPAPRIRPLFGGLGTPVFAAAAVSAASAYSAALVYRIADLLDRGEIPNPARPNPAGAPPLEPPDAYRWAGLVALGAVLIVAAAALYTVAVSRAQRARRADLILAADFPDAAPSAAHRIRRLHRVLARSHLTEHLLPLFIAFFLLAILGFGAVALDLVGIGPNELAHRLEARKGWLPAATSILTDVGIYVIGLVAVGVLLLSLLAYRSTQARRSVAVLWDLGLFWPRVVHPFAPPCYAERTVPELVRRVCWLARTGGVLIAGHSHGSTLAAAVILQLPPETRHRVALLTSGSPLRRLYARFSPAYLGLDTLHEIGERVGWRWRNLWRDTDPIGGWVFSRHRPTQPADVPGPAGLVDLRLRDPQGIDVPPMDTVPPPIEQHWPYHTGDWYPTAVRDLADRLRTPD